MFDLSTVGCRFAPPRAVASRLHNTSYFIAFRGLLARKMDLMTLTQKTGHSIYKSVCVYLSAKIQKQIQMSPAEQPSAKEIQLGETIRKTNSEKRPEYIAADAAADQPGNLSSHYTVRGLKNTPGR